MRNLPSKLPFVGATIFSEMSALALELQAINLGQGFPDYQPDDALLNAVCEAIQDGPNQYAPMTGVPALREGIANKVTALQGKLYNSETEITVTSGATEALSASILALIHPGDEVVLIDPAYDLYAPMVTVAGGVSVRVPMAPPNNTCTRYVLDWDSVAAAINPKTRMLILNFPHNPTGLTLRASDLDALETLAEKQNFVILSDEAYEHIVFDGRDHLSPASRPVLADRCVLVSSFAKTLHATGWKVGYFCAPAGISAEIRKVHQYLVFSVNTPIQRGIAAYLRRSHAIDTLPAFYQAKRDRLIHGLTQTRLRPLDCEGTFFLLVDVSALGQGKEKEIAIKLVQDSGVATIPVSAFYENANAAYANHQLLRFCFAKQNTTLDAAIKRLSAL